MSTNVMAQIAGPIPLNKCGQSDHPITDDERDLAVTVGYEIADRYGMDLAAYVAEHHAALAALAALEREYA